MYSVLRRTAGPGVWAGSEHEKNTCLTSLSRYFTWRAGRDLPFTALRAGHKLRVLPVYAIPNKKSPTWDFFSLACQEGLEPPTS